MAHPVPAYRVVTAPPGNEVNICEVSYAFNRLENKMDQQFMQQIPCSWPTRFFSSCCRCVLLVSVADMSMNNGDFAVKGELS